MNSDAKVDIFLHNPPLFSTFFCEITLKVKLLSAIFRIFAGR